MLYALFAIVAGLVAAVLTVRPTAGRPSRSTSSRSIGRCCPRCVPRPRRGP